MHLVTDGRTEKRDVDRPPHMRPVKIYHMHFTSELGECDLCCMISRRRSIECVSPLDSRVVEFHPSLKSPAAAAVECHVMVE